MKIQLKNSISTKLGLILASCLLVVLGGGLLTLLKQSSDQSKNLAEENIKETTQILLESIKYAMGEGINSADPYERIFSEISNIREVHVIPTDVIDITRETDFDAE